MRGINLVWLGEQHGEVLYNDVHLLLRHLRLQGHSPGDLLNVGEMICEGTQGTYILHIIEKLRKIDIGVNKHGHVSLMWRA